MMLALSYGFPRGLWIRALPGKDNLAPLAAKKSNGCAMRIGGGSCPRCLLTIRGQVKDYCPIRHRSVLNELSLIFSEARNEQVRFA